MPTPPIAITEYNITVSAVIPGLMTGAEYEVTGGDSAKDI
jgi:hypothetical protein